MKKVILITIAVLVATSVGWADTCPTANLTTYLGLGSAGCTISGNVFTGFSTNLSSSQAAHVTLTPILSGSGLGGFTASFNLGALAGTSTSVGFTATAPAGVMINDLSALFTGTGNGGSLALSLSNGSTLSATTGGGPAVVNFSGVGSLGVTGSLTAAATATGTTSLSVTPSVTSATPEPATLALFGTGLGIVVLLGLKRRLDSDPA